MSKSTFLAAFATLRTAATLCCCTGSTPQTGGGGAAGSIAAAEAKRLRDALSRVGVMGSEMPKAAFATKHLEQDLGRLLQVLYFFWSLFF